MNYKSIIYSFDIWIALAITAVTAFFLPAEIKSTFACSFYSVGITVLSIVFSLFFACLAIIMTSNDNEFVKFMEDPDRLFTRLLDSFKFTLSLLLFSLAYSIVAFQYFDFFVKIHSERHYQHKAFFLLFEFLFSYALCATSQSVYDTIRFTSRRTIFLKQSDKKNEPNT